MIANNARIIAYWCAAGKTKKKNMTLKEFWPMPYERFEGSTKANPEAVEWFKKYRQQIKNKKESSAAIQDEDGVKSVGSMVEEKE